MNWDLSTYGALEYMSREALNNSLTWFGDDEDELAKSFFVKIRALFLSKWR